MRFPLNITTQYTPTLKLKTPNYFTNKIDPSSERGLPIHGGTAIQVHRQTIH